MELKSFIKNDLNEGSPLFEALSSREEILAKDLPFEEKVLFFKEIFKLEQIMNPTVLLNISLIILGGSLEDSVFERQDIYFTSLIEYLDIKYELKEEINNFNIKIAQYFIGIIKGYSLQLDDTKVDVTDTYWNIFEVANFEQISKILNKVSINVESCPPVKNAGYLLNSLCKKNEVANVLAQLFLKNLE